MGHIRANIHQMRDARPTLSFGQSLEILAHLEEQHHKDGLSKLALGTWQKTDAEGADGGHRHQEVLIEGVAMRQALGRLFQRACTYYKIRYEVNQQQLPCGQLQRLLYDDSRNQQHHCHCYCPQLAMASVLMMMFMMMFMMVLMMVLVVVLVLVTTAPMFVMMFV